MTYFVTSSTTFQTLGKTQKIFVILENEQLKIYPEKILLVEIQQRESHSGTELK